MSTNPEGEIEIKPYSSRISIVKTDNGYLVNHYSKNKDILVPTFDGVINRLFEYNHEVHQMEPHLRYLTPNEEKAVENVRNSVLRLSRLEDENRNFREEKMVSSRGKSICKKLLGF
jgi:hypothetical protein